MGVLTVWLRLQTSDRCCVLAPAFLGQQSASAMAVIYGWNVPRQLVVDNRVCNVPLMAEQMSRLTWMASHDQIFKFTAPRGSALGVTTCDPVAHS